jgi:hypothetical protein
MIKNNSIDTLTNTERIKIAIRLAKEYRRMNYPDECSLAFIKSFINDLRVEGFTEEEIRYAITSGQLIYFDANNKSQAANGFH